MLLLVLALFVAVVWSKAPASFDVTFVTTVKNGTSGTIKVSGHPIIASKQPRCTLRENGRQM